MLSYCRRIVLGDYEVYKNRMDDLMQEIEAKLSEIPYIDKLMGINRIGLKTVSCFIAEAGDLRAKACEITEREVVIPQKQEVVPLSFAEQEFCIPPAKTASVEGIHPDTVITIRMNGIQLDISNRAARETIANTISVLQELC